MSLPTWKGGSSGRRAGTAAAARGIIVSAFLFLALPLFFFFSLPFWRPYEIFSGARLSVQRAEGGKGQERKKRGEVLVNRLDSLVSK